MQGASTVEMCSVVERWTSSGGGGGVVGWLNTKMFDETGDAVKSQGWTALILDTNGNGKRDDYVEPNQPVDPTKDKRIAPVFYAVMPSPVDGSVWGTIRAEPRLDRAPRPRLQPAGDGTGRDLQRALPGFGPRGGDIDSKGVVWVSLASGHIGSFDRRKCKGRSTGRTPPAITAPKAGRFYQYPGPGLRGHRREQRRVELLHAGSISTTRSGWARTFRVDGQPEGRSRRAQGRQDGLAARALSARLLRQGARRPHR